MRQVMRDRVVVAVFLATVGWAPLGWSASGKVVTLEKTKAGLEAKLASLVARNAGLRQAAGAAPPRRLPTLSRKPALLFKARRLRGDIRLMEAHAHNLERENEELSILGEWMKDAPAAPATISSALAQGKRNAIALRNLHEVDPRIGELRKLMRARGYDALALPESAFGSSPGVHLGVALEAYTGTLKVFSAEVLQGEKEAEFSRLRDDAPAHLNFAHVSRQLDRLVRDALRLSPDDFAKRHVLREKRHSETSGFL